MHYRRYDYIKKLLHHRGSPYVKVLYGPRGCGKTTILADFAFRMVRRGFPESRILVITFDDPAVPRDAQTVYEGIISRMEGQEETLLILDEVEKLPHFEKVIDRLFLHRHVDIYLSGSGRSVLTPALKNCCQDAYSRCLYFLCPTGSICPEERRMTSGLLNI